MTMSRYVARHWVTRLDRWTHFHRFDWRWVCDLHDVLSGASRSAIRSDRRRGQPAHYRTRSMKNHPSVRSVVEVPDG